MAAFCLSACAVQLGMAPEGAVDTAQLAFPAPSAFAQLRIAQGAYGVVVSTENGPGLAEQNVSADAAGNRLTFSPLSGAPELANCAYAVYRVPVDDDGDLHIDFDWFVAPEAGSLYVGLGNQSLDRWDWTAMFDAQETFEPGAVDDYRDTAHSMLLTVLLLPSDGTPQLNSLTVQTSTQLGWQFVTLASYETVGTWDPRSSFDVEIVGDKPAIFYKLKTGPNFDEQQPYLAVSSTASGGDSADWATYALDSTDFSFGDLKDIGGGYGIYNELTGRYYYSSSPDGNFVGEDVALTDNGNPTPFQRFGSVSGKPAIAYFYDVDSPTDNNYTPRYCSSDNVSGGTWTDCEVASDRFVNTVILPHAVVSPLAEHDGLPVFAFYENDLGMVVASASVPNPSVVGDWTVTTLGGGSGGRLGLFHADSTLSLCDGTILNGTDVFTVYQLTGNNIAQSASWTITLVDSLNLGDVSNWSFGELNKGVGARAFYSDVPGNILGGTNDPLVQYGSEAPANSPAAWQQQTLSQDIEPYLQQVSTFQFVEVQGQPAYAYWYSEKSGTADPDARGRAALVWAHYVP